jgi:porphobilinogen deaminase
MAYGDWDKILAAFESISISPRYEEHAREMISLIPHIRSETVFSDVVPIVSLGVLRLEIPDKRMLVSIWCNQIEESYTIFLEHHEHGLVRELEAKNTEIIAVLADFVNEIRKS